MTKEERIKQLKRRKALLCVVLGAGLVVGIVSCGKRKDSEEPSSTTEITTEITTEATTEEITTPELENEYINNLLKEYNTKSGKNIDKTDLGIRPYSKPSYVYYTISEDGTKSYKFDIYRTNQDSSITPEQIIEEEKIPMMYVYIDKTDDTLVGAVGEIKEENETKVINIDVAYIIYNDKDCYPSIGYLQLDDVKDYVEAGRYLEERQAYLDSKELILK